MGRLGELLEIGSRKGGGSRKGRRDWKSGLTMELERGVPTGADVGVRVKQGLVCRAVGGRELGRGVAARRDVGV